jgi:putrescine transport system ATP-binding protein
VNLILARVVRAAGDASVVAIGGDHALAVALPPGTAVGQAVLVAVRPENVRVAALAPAAPDETVPGKIADVTFLGNLSDGHVTLDDGTRVRVQLGSEETFDVGQRVGLRFAPGACTVFGA